MVFRCMPKSIAIEVIERVLASLRRANADLLGPGGFVVLGALLCQLGLGFGYVVNPLAGDIIAEFDWQRARYSEALSWQIWVIALASPLVGSLVSRFGARRILIAATLLIGSTFFLYAQIESVWQLRTVVVLLGLAVVGLGDITVGQIVMRWIERGRGLALGIVYTGSNLGGFLLVPFALGIAEREGWREALEQLGWIALLVLLPAAVFLVRERTGSDPTLEVQAEPARSDGESTLESLTLAAALRTRSFWILAFSLFCFFSYFLALLQHLVLHWTDLGMQRTVASDYYRSALGLGIVSKIVLGVIADRIPSRSALRLDFGLLAVSSFLLLLTPGGPLVIWSFVVLFGFSSAARDVVYPLIIGECFGIRHLAAIYGAIMFAILPAGVLGPIFAGAIHDQTGSYLPAFASFALGNAGAFLALAFVRDER